jgi:hypothetical protein
VADRGAARRPERGQPQPVTQPGCRAHELEQAGRQKAAVENSTEETREIGRS